MRVLFLTWDGAGSITPTAALIAALSARGHEVHVLGHDSQKFDIEQNGGVFHPYTTAPQLNQNIAQPVFDFHMWFEGFNSPAAIDFKESIRQLRPDMLIVDCMMRQALKAAKDSRIKFVAFVHAAPSAMAPWAAEIASADLALCASYAAFDHGYRFPPNMHFVGPLRPAAEPTPFTRKFAHRPLVVASLSSGHQGSFQPKVLQNVCDALGKLPVEGLVTTGKGIDPASLDTSPNVTVLRGVDHTQILPEAALFITHCGHGSVMIALRAGTPMLCMPPIADQPHNAELVRKLGLGEVIPNVLAPANIIAEAATRLLADAATLQRSKDFAANHTYEALPAKAVQLLEELAQKKTKVSFLARLGIGSAAR
jgi:MGT family glycosyltransferase